MISASAHYAARVDAVLAQRTRLRGSQPPGDLFGELPPDHPLLTANPRRPLEPNLEILASYLEPDDTIVDVGGGAGRMSLPLALRCREVVNIDPSAGMLAAFAANAVRAGIANVRAVQSGWPPAEPPRGTVALVNHVTYLTREIVPFLEALERVASRRVLLTVGNPPPPSRNRSVFELIFGEPAEPVPGHRELVPVLWELGIEPDVIVLPDAMARAVEVPDRAAAVREAVGTLRGHQWAFWPLTPELEDRARQRVEAAFADLFDATPGGYATRWWVPAREVLITWTPRR